MICQRGISSHQFVKSQFGVRKERKMYPKCLYLLIVLTTGAISTNIQDVFLKYPSYFTEKCLAQIQTLNKSDHQTLLKMFDATSRIPSSGMANGDYYDLGNFDECYGIESLITDDEVIYGKYCLSTSTISSPFKLTRKQSFPKPEPRTLNHKLPGYHWAICIPSGCTAKEFSIAFNLSSITIYNNFIEDWCYSKDTEPKLDTGAWVTIGILIGFLVIMIASTIFDVYCHYQNRRIPHDILIAFSAFTNGQKLLKTTNNPDQLLCLNGIKGISMMWVVLGHVYGSAEYGPIQNYNDVVKYEQDPANMYMISATLSVDSFFVVGGLVTVYAYMKAIDRGVKFNVIMFYVHRYLRLTPVLIIVILIHMYLLRFMGNGPIWNTVDMALGQSCRSSWRATITYLENYFLDHGICVPQTWYLSVDMQLFVLSPLILIPIAKWPKKTLIAIGILFIASMVVSFVVGTHYELPAFIMTTRNSSHFSKDYYFPPWTRFGPYILGMALGYLIYFMKKTSRKIDLKRWQICGIWLATLAIMSGILWGPYDLFIHQDTDYDDYRLSAHLYLGYHRHVWSIGLSLVIFLCVSGFGGPIDSFLSHPLFQFLTKISYSVYLTHYAPILMRYSALKSPIHFNNFDFLRDFWGDFILSVAISVVFCLMFESPIITIEKIIFAGRMSTKKANHPVI